MDDVNEVIELMADAFLRGAQHRGRAVEELNVSFNMEIRRVRQLLSTGQGYTKAYRDASTIAAAYRRALRWAMGARG